LPEDKAVQIARQVCAGLAAAHEQGVLHRDLKPSNLMIDGRGQARITDFGLAVLDEGGNDAEARAGTPAYMAPEQLDGGAVTTRTDLYSLGLVLYELFTGRRPFDDGSTPAETSRLRRESTPRTPSSHVTDLDPLVERLLLRCLERDPARRPESALAVAAALPGGDPLAAALAAGETPSPEMVAAAGNAGSLHPGLASALLAAVLGGLLFLGAARERTTVLGLSPAPKPPQFLEERAREILAEAGHGEAPPYRAKGLSIRREYLGWIAENDSAPGRWRALRNDPPSPLLFWYRQSPAPLEPVDPSYEIGPKPRPDPAYSRSGTAEILLDGQARLLALTWVPPQRDEGAGIPEAVDWAPLLEAAGLRADGLRSVEPQWTPPVFADRRTAWEGAYPDRPELPLRVEAASAGGRPVHFQVIAPWSRPTRDEVLEERGPPLIDYVFWGTLGAGALLAWRNIRRGRGDRRGAFRLAVYFLVVSLLTGVLRGLRGSDVAAMVLDWTLTTWIFYMALEPLVRRRWPESIVGWSRVLTGRLRDPLVGRDLLVGGAVGTLIACAWSAYPLLLALRGLAAGRPAEGSLGVLLGARHVLADVLEVQPWAVTSALFGVMLFTLLRLLLKRTWATAIVLLAVATVLEYLDAGAIASAPILVSILLVTGVVFLGVLVRFGLLALVAAELFSRWPVPITPDVSLWYAGLSLAALSFPVALAVYGFITSLGRRPLIPERLLGD
jgi:serine/threonine-protein kinase